MAGNQASMTYKLFGVDVNASRAIRGVGDEAARTDEKLKTFGVGVAKWGTAAAGASVGVLGLAGAVGVGLAGALAVGAAGLAATAPKVKSEFADLGADVKKSLLGMSGPVQDSLLGLANLLRSTFDDLKPTFAALFKALAPVVTTLGTGLVNAVAVLVRALPGLLAQVQPLVDVFAAALPAVMGGLVAALRNMLGPTGQNAKAFSQLLAAVVTLLPALGTLLGAFVQVGAFLVRVFRPVLVPLASGILAIVAAVKIWAAVTKLITAAQVVLDAVLTANPIGLVIVAVAALAAGLIFAYKHSETFRKIVDGAFRTVAAAGKFMWENVLKPVFRFLISTWLTVASGIVHGAATAFGWVPGIGPKLRTAAAAFDKFAAGVNRSLNSIDDERVNVTARAGITWTADAARFRLAAGRMARGGRIPGYGGGDQVPILAEPGEAVVDKVRTRRYAAVLAAMGVPGFAKGGLIPSVGFQDTVTAGPLQQMATGLAKGLGAAVGSGLQKAMAQAAAAFGGGAGPRVSGPIVDIVRAVASRYGWGAGSQWSALSWIISHESGWNPNAQNPTSTAYGLFQFLNGTWGGVGGRKTADPFLQAVYGLRYISGRYGSPLGAQAFWRAHGWYDQGGWLPPGLSLAYNGTGRPERVSPPGRGGDVHIHFHGPVYGDRQALVREIRSGLKAQLNREGKPLATQL